MPPHGGSRSCSRSALRSLRPFASRALIRCARRCCVGGQADSGGPVPWHDGCSGGDSPAEQERAEQWQASFRYGFPTDRSGSSPRGRRPPSSPSPSAPAWPRRPSWPPSTATTVDLSSPLADGAEVAIVTADSDAGREVLRHSTAHVLAQAVLRLWPGAKYAIGPVIENGFYYDFELPGGAHFSDDDLARIETEMRAIMAEDQPFVRHEHALDEGLELFADQPFKQEIIEAVGSGADEVDAGGSVVSTYWNSDTFTDLCRGPHVPSTSRLGHFKLMRVAGAYWRGDEKRAAAPADLRDGVGVREGAGCAPPPAGGGRAARPPQAGGRARPVQLSRGDRIRAGHLPPQGRDDPPAHGGLLTAASRRRGLRVRQLAAHHQERPLRDLGPPGLVRRRRCTRRWSSTGGRSTTSSP